MTQLALALPAAPTCRACGHGLKRSTPDGLGPVCRKRASVIQAAIAKAHADGVGFWAVLAAIGPPPRGSPPKPHPRQIPLFD
jgi:hypothetical protein